MGVSLLLPQPPQHFHDGRKAQQHIEMCWKQLESVSEKPTVQEMSL